MNLTYWYRIPRCVRWVLGDALLVSAAAAMYGSLFGVFEASILHDTSQVVIAMGRFALGGFLAGAILGSLGALTEPGESRSFKDSQRQTCDAPARRSRCVLAHPASRLRAGRGEGPVRGMPRALISESNPIE